MVGAGEGRAVPRGRPPKERLTVGQVLRWADAHRERTGAWPTLHSGPVGGAPMETWAAVNAALRFGVRGLPGGDTLHRLLRRERGLPEQRGRRQDEGRRTHIQKLRAKGLNQTEIARRLGVTRQAVSAMLLRPPAAAD